MENVSFIIIAGLFMQCFLLNWTSVDGQQSLDKAGVNVCSRKFKYKTYYQTTVSYVSYENYRTCCKRFIWCTSRCTKYRTKRRTFTKSALREKEMTAYYCCPGYARSGNACPRPICTPSCQNGDCVAPNKCRCKKGFVGQRCETEVNECKADVKPCQQVCTNLRGTYACSCLRGYRKNGTDPTDSKCENVNECKASNYLCNCAINNVNCKASCVDTIGSYRCQCSPGFRLVNNKICTDEDECRTNTHNCEQKCLNTGGGFVCDCNVGYWLRADKRTCYDLNECRAANGGCEQECTNTKGSYLCSCRKGFRLMYDKVRCQDVDECITTRPCDSFHGSCQNMYGSYKCLCDKGYELQDDKKTCSDVNECQRNHGCQQTCHNTEGSYFCSCLLGFRLSADKRNCIDIDECKEGLHNCEQNCQNTGGSFKCSCRTGFYLHDDKKTCRPFPCKTLYKPRHGNINCTGVNVGDVCHFGCDTGYEVDGNALRICMPTSRWSLDEPKCVPQQCPAARPPKFGSLVLPCVEEYDSKCIIKCQKGYQLEGSHTTKCILKDSETVWEANKTHCQEIRLCAPNPCLNGGECRIISFSQHRCDCTGTGYTGENCHIGVISLPLYPQLKKDTVSTALTINARPNKEIIITPESNEDGMIFTPAQILIRSPQTSSAFTVKASATGLFRITYRISGSNRLNFLQPSDSFLYVVEETGSMVNIPSLDMMVKSPCKSLHLDKCQSGEVMSLMSSCPWSYNGSPGYVAVEFGQERVPLSLGGVTLPQTGIDQWNYRRNGRLDVNEETQRLLVNKNIKCTPATGCPNSLPNIAEQRFLIERNLFSHAFYRSLSSITPWWLGMRMADTYTGFEYDNIQSMVIKASKMRDLKTCINFPSFTDGIFSVYRSRAPVTMTYLSKFIKIGTSGTSKTCSAIDMCRKASYLSLPKDQTISFTQELKAMGMMNTECKLYGIGVGTTVPIATACVDIYDEVEGSSSKRKCIDAGVWLRTTMKSQLANTNVSFQGDVWLEPTNIEKMPLDQFSSKTDVVAKGDLVLATSMDVNGKPLGVQITDGNAAIYGSIGGGRGCPFCTGDDLAFNIDSKNVQFDYSNSKLTFHFNNKEPKIDNKFQVRLYQSLSGGQVTAVLNAVEIRLRYRVLQRSLPLLLTGTVSTLRMGRATYAAEIKHIQEFIAHVKPLLAKIYQLVSISSPNYEEVYKANSEIQSSLALTKNVLKYLNERLTAFEKNPRLKSMAIGRITSVIRFFKQISAIRVRAKALPMTEVYNGASYTYQGDVCISSLCFTDSLISILDSRVDDVVASDCRACTKTLFNDFSNGFIQISASQLVNKTIGGILHLSKSTMIHAKVSKVSDTSSFSFPSLVSVFGDMVNVNVNGETSVVQFKTDNVKLPGGLSFDLRAHASRSEKTKWKHLRFDIDGRAPETSDILQRFQILAQDYIENVQVKTEKRLNKTEGELQTNIERMEKQDAIVKAKKFWSQQTETVFKQASIDYKRAFVKVNSSLFTFRSYMVGERLQNMEKTLDSFCQFQSCQDTCLSVPTCSVCQEAIFVKAKTTLCQQVVQKIRTTVAEPLKTDCHTVRYVFTPIYTGTCRKGGDGKLTGSLTSVGAGVGTLVGTMILPGVGSAIGGLIGTAVGFVASLFSSCDESYEVHKGVFNDQEPCTRKTFETKIRDWVRTECMTKDQSVLSGYDHPVECQCSNSSCAIVQDPVCLQNNNECRKLRIIKATQIMQAAGAYNDSYSNLQNAEKELEVARLKLNEAENQHLLVLRDYEREISILKQYELQVRIANRTLLNADVNLGIEKCLAAAASNAKHTGNVILMKNVTFTSTNLINNDLQFDVAMQTWDGSKMDTLSFVYVFDDADVSIKQGVQRITRQLLCSHILKRRRRRSNDAERIDQVTGAPSFARDFQKDLTHSNLTYSQATCLVSETIFTYLDTVMSTLINHANSAKSKSVDVKHANDNLSLTKKASKVNTNNIKAIESELTSIEKRLQPKSIISHWRETMDVLTSANNFTGCLTFDDCLQQSFDDLREFPSMLTTDRSTYIKGITALQTLVTKFGEEVLSIDTIISQAYLAQKQLERVKRMTSFCASKPLVEVETIDSQVVGLVGETLVLKCITKSQLHVYYTWTKDNVTLTGETGSLLVIDVTDDEDEGAYKCHARNRAGRNESEEVFVAVYSRPALQDDQPVDVQYHDTMPDLMLPKMICNVTADPPANISWYFAPLSDPTKVNILKSEDKPILSFDNPTANQNGYYYCIADNGYGKVKSRMARLDILHSYIPRQAITISFDVETGRDSSINKTEYKKSVEQLGVTTSDQQIDVEVEAKSSRTVNVAIQLTDSSAPTRSRSAFYTMNHKDTDQQRLKRVSQSRQSLASVVQRYLSNITHNRGRASENIEKSLSLAFTGDLCPDGYTLHQNGFTCVECKAGTFARDRNCQPCLIGTYQSAPGQMSCIRCQNDQVTKDVGATSQSQCVKPSLSGTDIMFILDSSGSIAQYNWKKVTQFVHQFVTTFVTQTNNIAIGIITFNNDAKLAMPLAVHDTDHLIKTIDSLPYTQGLTRTYDALKLAKEQFHNLQSRKGQRFAFVLTDGKSTSQGGQPGFRFVREQSQDLFEMDVHVVSVGVGGQSDNSELLAMATYPKRDNSLRLQNFDKLIASTTSITVKALRGTCDLGSRDILLAIESSSQISDRRWKRATEFLTEFSQRISALSHTRVAFSSFAGKLKFTHNYQTLTASTAEAQVKGIPYLGGNLDINSVLFDLLNEYMTEAYQSIAIRKILIIMTYEALQSSTVQDIHRYYPHDQISIINIVMTLNDQVSNIDEDEDALDPNRIVTSFTMAQMTPIINAIKLQQTTPRGKTCQNNQ